MPGLYTRACASLVFPLHERLKGHATVAVRRDLERTQWWPAERLVALQLEKLRALLGRASAEVPYYRDVMNRLGLAPAQVGTLRDLAKLPFLTKDLIRANADRLKSDRASSLKRYNTGGSSGEPLVFFIGADRVTHDVAAKWRATRWWGVDIGDPEIVVWGSLIELAARSTWCVPRCLRTKLLSAFEMSPQSSTSSSTRSGRRVRRCLQTVGARAHRAACARAACAWTTWRSGSRS
jgi:phenylacetate-CoA ligase